MCNKFIGVCMCEIYYVIDEIYGCVLKDYSLILIMCIDEVFDREVDDVDLRVRLLYVLCFFGIRLGSFVIGMMMIYIIDL